MKNALMAILLIPSFSFAVPPEVYIQKRVDKVLHDLKNRPYQPVISDEHIPILDAGYSRNSWLRAVYSAGLVEANWATQMLSDKLMAYRVFERELAGQMRAYFPKTVGLREFLSQNKLIKANGEIEDGEKIEEALHEQFPSGFMVRPAVGVSPNEKSMGLYDKTDDFLVELTKPGSILYQKDHAQSPVRSHILAGFASGEAVVLQEDFATASALRSESAKKNFREIRIHTFEYQVIPDSTPHRWYQGREVAKEDLLRAEAFVESFLHDVRAASPQLLNRIALGIEVAQMPSGELKIFEIISNRGQKVGWSGYLDQPRVLGAYARHFERLKLARFGGLSGVVLRANFANYVPYWELRRERATGTMARILAFFPPLP